MFSLMKPAKSKSSTPSKTIVKSIEETIPIQKFTVSDVLKDLEGLESLCNTERIKIQRLSSIDPPPAPNSEWQSVAKKIESWIEKAECESKMFESLSKEALAKDITFLRQTVGDLIRTASFAMPE